MAHAVWGRMYWLVDGEVVDVDVKLAPAESKAAALAESPELRAWAVLETCSPPANMVLWLKPGKRIASLIRAGLASERSREPSRR